MKLPTFWGGIHPPQNKELTVSESIVSYRPKGELVFPMSQHIGAPCAPVVAKGDRVFVGTRLGNNDAFVSAPILSSVSGTVKDVTMRLTPPGAFETCVVVEDDGKNELAPEWKPLENYQTADPKEYVKRIRDAGIVGFGGATFPTAVKLSPPPDRKIRWLIVNGVECEPYLNCDNRLMQEGTEKIVQGLALTMRLFPEAEGVIAIENNKPEAIAILKDAVAKSGLNNVTVQPLAVKYPQGAEKMLIEALTGQEFVITALPADVGCIILNVRTVYQIYSAIVEGLPAVTRVVTVTGDAVAHPKNIKTPQGTMIRELIDLCGGFKEQPAKILSGGPMMGLSMRSIDVPVVKGTSGILCLTAKSTMLKPIRACLRCGRCVEACPMGLVPTVLEPLVRARQYKRFEEEGGMNCIECGSCTYMCPANRPLTQGCRDGKASVTAMRRKAAAK
ncbi:electron transport complex subunit RsxC [Synergistes jonesii]|uniref:electron transport complex subunit RsxC n=2 Tax=Synergistes jonesii TaxID=2754 RepID=UPI00332C98E3